MTELSVACRDYVPADACSISIHAENAEDLIEAAVEHAHAAHFQEDTPALRGEIRRFTKSETLLQRC